MFLANAASDSRLGDSDEALPTNGPLITKCSRLRGTCLPVAFYPPQETLVWPSDAIDMPQGCILDQWRPCLNPQTHDSGIELKVRYRLATRFSTAWKHISTEHFILTLYRGCS